MSFLPKNQSKMLKKLNESVKHQVSIFGVSWLLLTDYRFPFNLINKIAVSLVASDTTGVFFHFLIGFFVNTDISLRVNKTQKCPQFSHSSIFHST